MIKTHIFYNQWYFMAQGIIETKLFKEPKKTIKKNLFLNTGLIQLLKVELLTLSIYLSF